MRCFASLRSSGLHDQHRRRQPRLARDQFGLHTQVVIKVTGSTVRFCSLALGGTTLRSSAMLNGARNRPTVTSHGERRRQPPLVAGFSSAYRQRESDGVPGRTSRLLAWSYAPAR